MTTPTLPPTTEAETKLLGFMESWRQTGSPEDWDKLLEYAEFFSQVLVQDYEVRQKNMGQMFPYNMAYKLSVQKTGTLRPMTEQPKCCGAEVPRGFTRCKVCSQQHYLKQTKGKKK